MTKKEITNMTLLVFVAMNFVLAMSGSLFGGILDKVAEQMQVSIAQTGLLNSLYAYGAGIGVPISLVLFRKVERTKVLKIMLLITIIASFGTIYAQNFTQLLISRFITGVTGNSYGVLATVLVASFSPKEKLGRSLALLITGAALALVVGVPLTRILSQVLSWETIFLLLIIIMLFSLLYFIRNLQQEEQTSRNIDFKQELALFKNRETALVIMSSFITFLGYGAFFTYSTPYLLSLFSSLDPIMGGILVIIGLASFTGNLLGGLVSDRIGYINALIIGSTAQVFIALLLFMTQSIMWLNVILAILWVMNGWFIGLQLNTGINVATNSQSSFLLSINSSGIQLGIAIGASIASVIIANIGIEYVIIISLVTSLAVSALQLYERKIKNMIVNY